FAKLTEEHWVAPKYWEMHEDQWWEMTLHGFRPVNDSDPVTHISHYEADAYATWAGARLPTEFEWEVFAKAIGEVATDNILHFQPSSLDRISNEVWEWTRSAYLPYPGYKPAAGAL